MSTYTSYYQQELQKLLAEAVQQQTEMLAAGHLPDYATYQKTVGVIFGLRMAMELMDEADRIIREQK